MKTLTLPSPAKLNLVLDVLGKRPDGFHELKTLFERIDLSDSITLKRRNDSLIRVECRHPQVPKGAKNLVVRVAQQLREAYKIKEGITIAIDKKIPVAAGLAGGSTNAATVLMGLNQLWQLGLSQKQLINYAARVGSDVAFFIHHCSFGVGQGRGEKIRVLPLKTKLWHVLVTPRFKMYTKDVFARLNAGPVPGNLRLTNKKDNVNILVPYLRKNALGAVATALSNDLEPAIFALRPDFKLLKQKLLDAGALGACCSGSGPSVYGLARSKEHALEIKSRFDRRYSQVFVVSTY